MSAVGLSARDPRTAEILIAGAGVGGLAAALSLHAAGFHRIRLLEAARQLKPLGVGLNILPNAVRELMELGLYEEVLKGAVITRELAMFNGRGNHIWSEPRGQYAGCTWPQLSVHRGHLQAAMAEAVRTRLGEGALVCDARVVGSHRREDGRLEVEVHHRGSGAASVLTCDLLVGADGIRSAVRALLHPSEPEPLCNGITMWRGTSWCEPFMSGQSMAVLGDPKQRMVLYPILPAQADSNGKVLVNWVASRPAQEVGLPRGDWSRQSDVEAVLRHFGDWKLDWIDIPAIVARAPAVYEYPMVDRDPLPQWTFGRVTLLGDAAHPMYPMGSNGATQAIIDGRVLAYHLATSGDLDEGLHRYEEERRPATKEIQLINRQQGPEMVIKLANDRAPRGFNHIHEVIPHAELEEISRRYAKVGGFDRDTINAARSYTVARTT